MKNTTSNKGQTMAKIEWAKRTNTALKEIR